MEPIINCSISDFLGFGDFLRGSISTYQICKLHNRPFGIDYSNHIMSRYLINNHIIETTSYTTSDVVKYHVENLNQLQHYICTNPNKLRISTNIWSFQSTENDVRTFIRESLQPNEFLNKRINEYMTNLQIVEKNYICIHIRTGDQTLVDHQSNTTLYDTYLQQIDIHIESFKKAHENMSNLFDIVIISDDINLKRYANMKRGWKYIDNHLGHIAKNCDDVLGVENTLVEFFIMAKSCGIVQKTVYHWPSGFSRWCAEIFEIPFVN